MIYRGIKAKRSADKASAIFCTQENTSTSVFFLQHVPEQQLRYYRTQSLLQYPFKFTVKGKICGYSPYKNDSLLEASAALVILELSKGMLPTDPLTLQYGHQ
jgi:hypothetical protein